MVLFLHGTFIHSLYTAQEIKAGSSNLSLFERALTDLYISELIANNICTDQAVQINPISPNPAASLS